VGKHLTMNGLKHFLENCYDVELEPRELIKLFAFSKMNILDEMDGEKSNDKMQFVEFLEFVSRLADYVYKDYVELEVKLKRFLEVMLNSFGMKFKEPAIDEPVQEESDSDDD
jgi:hypothetical protein